MATLPPAIAAGALYDSLLQAALKHFFPRARFETQAIPSESSLGRLSIEPTHDPGALAVRWFGSRHTLRVPAEEPFSPHETRFARAIASVLAARYQAIFDPKMIAERGDLFRGAIEDRYIGAFLEDGKYSLGAADRRADQIATAIEVLRVAALSSYENRSISTGVLLLDADADPCRPERDPRLHHRKYGHELTGVKSFYRLSDGVHTVFLVNRQSELLDIVDIDRWANEVCGSTDLTVPCAEAFRPHARATIGSRHVCVVLSPSHEIKVFSEGMQTFTFRHANWHLLDPQARYWRWVQAAVDPMVAERLFQAALDLAEARHGALFVVLRNPVVSLPQLIAPADRLSSAYHDAAVAAASSRLGPPGSGEDLRLMPSRRDLLELVGYRKVTDLDRDVLVALASMDGATVVDQQGNLLAAGAILLHPPSAQTEHGGVVEGARTTAAIGASQHGPVLKVSEDGVITLFDGQLVWTM
jgi:hypothetical protein